MHSEIDLPLSGKGELRHFSLNKIAKHLTRVGIDLPLSGRDFSEINSESLMKAEI